MNEAFPLPGAMMPQHFTTLAEGIEAQIAGKTKRAVKKAAKAYRKAHLTFDTTQSIISVIDSSDATALATMPLLELLSFRVLRGQNTSYTEALLFAKHLTSDTLVAHRIVFESQPDITTFHSTLKKEFNAVAQASNRIVKVVGGMTTCTTNGPDTTKSGGDSSAMSMASSSAGSEGDSDAASSAVSSENRRRNYFFSNLDSEDGELIISDSPADQSSRIGKSLASEGDSDVVEVEC
jgi:hypothetical protein